MSKYFLWTNDAGVVFDSRSYPKLKINKIHRPLMPPITTTAIKAGKKAGSYLQANTLDSFELKLDLTLYAETDALLRKDLRTLALSLYSSKSGKLTLSDELDVYINCQITGDFDFNNFASLAEGTVSFILSEPFAYKTTEANILFPTTPPTQIVLVDGFRIFPRFRIVPTSDVTSIRVDNTTTGKFFLLTGMTFWTSTPYIFDCEKNLFYRESDNFRLMNFVDLASDFFALEKGNNTLVLTPTTGVSIRVYYRDRYL